jgi:hypothetical protein
LKEAMDPETMNLDERKLDEALGEARRLAGLKGSCENFPGLLVNQIEGTQWPKHSNCGLKCGFESHQSVALINRSFYYRCYRTSPQ